ncbi:MAG TPA: DUF885 domain-containing protein [Terrimicrobiaceae bacterium]|nr:DUF885 domain-containing protein [Terrimicrobiaceae bacterium]
MSGASAQRFLAAADGANVREFRAIVDRFLAETHERFPESASRLGLDAFNSRLGRNDVPTHGDQIGLLEKTLATTEMLPEAAFLGDDWLDRRTFLAMLRTQLLELRDLRTWRSNPQIHFDAAIDSVFDLVVRNSGNLGDVFPAIESRLAKLPEFLAAGAACVERPVPLWTRLARRSCEGAVQFLREVESELLGHSVLPARTKQLVTGAVRAFQTYADSLGRKRPGEPRGYSVGGANFEFLIRERLGLDWTLPEALANGQRLVAQMRYRLEREAARYGSRTAGKILQEAAAKWTPSRPLLEEYRKATLTIKARLAELGIATLPRGETLKVLPAPPFLRHHFPTAAYNAPPPFSKKQEGIFWVNDLSQEFSDPKRKVSEIRQHFGLELTSAHEAYPGHHLQFALQNRHRSKLRRLAGHAIFYEGWTMWCEQLAVERGLARNPHARLQQLHDALWRAHRIVIDCGLHGGSLTYETACKVLMTGVDFTKARAGADVNWYTSSPTVPMSYLIGLVEIEKLYSRFVKREAWTLKQFNDWMLSHGAVPWSWILRARDLRA